jgi:hypothetical protein
VQQSYASGQRIDVVGLNPFSSWTIAATPIWSGNVTGTPFQIAIPAPASGPRPRDSHPAGLSSIAWLGDRPNPCLPIRWRYNPTGERGSALSTVTSAVNSISAATGITFIYEGTTTEYENSSVGPYSIATVDTDHPRTYLLVQWEDPARPVVDPANTGVLGVGRTGYRRGRTGFAEEFTDGQSVTLRNNPLLDGPNVLLGTVLHELAHAVGLDHTSDPSSVLYPVNQGLTDWNASDRASLALVGMPATQGCLS